MVKRAVTVTTVEFDRSKRNDQESLSKALYTPDKPCSLSAGQPKPCYDTKLLKPHIVTKHAWPPQFQAVSQADIGQNSSC